MPESILLYRPDHIGDYILTTPVIHALKKSFPDSQIVLAAGNWSKPLIKGNPYIDEVLPVNLPWMERYGEKNWGRTRSEIGEIRMRNFPVVFNLRKALKECLISLLFGTGERWGFRVPKSGWVHNRRVPYDPEKHIVENYLDLAEAFGAAREHAGLELFLDDEERTAPLRAYNLNPSYIVIAPGAGHKPKMWPAERWYMLVKWLLEQGGWNIVITGSAKEAELGDAIAAGQSGSVINLAGKISLRELAAVIGSARALLTVDSAAMHIGSAVKVPMAALFGFTDPRHWGPYPLDGKRMVVKATSMEAINVRDVQGAVEALLFG